MTVFVSRNGRKRALLLGFLAASTTAEMAHAETAMEMNVGLNARASTNPFLEDTGTDVIPSVGLSISPALTVEDEISAFRIEANLNVDQYTKLYGNELSGQLSATAHRELSEYTSVNAGMGARSSRSRWQDILFATPGELLDPSIDPIIPDSDLSNTGRRNRQTSFFSQFGVNHRLSELDSIGLNASAVLNKIDGLGQNDTRHLGAQFNYSRRLSPQTSISASVSGGITDTIGLDRGDSRYVTPLLRISHRLSETMLASIGAGVSFTETENVNGVSDSRQSLSVEASLCDRRLTSGWCASFARRAAPLALGGVTISTSADFAYDIQASAVDAFSLSARYSTNSHTTDLGFANPFSAQKIVGVSGQYSRKINDRLSALVNTSYTRFLDDDLGRKPNFQVSAGISYYFGKLR